VITAVTIMVRLRKIQIHLRACAKRSAMVKQGNNYITNQIARLNGIAKMEKFIENNLKINRDCESNSETKIHEALKGKLSYYFSSIICRW